MTFDCSLSLLNQRSGRLRLLCERWPCFACRFHCRLMRDLAAQSPGKVRLVVGVELRVIATTRYHDPEHPYTGPTSGWPTFPVGSDPQGVAFDGAAESRKSQQAGLRQGQSITFL